MSAIHITHNYITCFLLQSTIKAHQLCTTDTLVVCCFVLLRKRRTAHSHFHMAQAARLQSLCGHHTYSKNITGIPMSVASVRTNNGVVASIPSGSHHSSAGLNILFMYSESLWPPSTLRCGIARDLCEASARTQNPPEPACCFALLKPGSDTFKPL